MTTTNSILERSAHFDLSARAADSADLSRIPVLLPSGAMGRDGRGPYTFDIAALTANIRSQGADIPVFIDHLPGRAVGWIGHTKPLIAMPDGTYEAEVSYTAEGLDLLKSKSYRYNSPTYWLVQDPRVLDRQAGEIVGLLGVSLTNLPNLPLRALNSVQAGGKAFAAVRALVQSIR